MKELNTSIVYNIPIDLEKELRHQKADTSKARIKFMDLFKSATKEEYHYMCDKLESSYYIASNTLRKLSTDY